MNNIKWRKNEPVPFHINIQDQSTTPSRACGEERSMPLCRHWTLGCPVKLNIDGMGKENQVNTSDLCIIFTATWIFMLINQLKLLWPTYDNSLHGSRIKHGYKVLMKPFSIWPSDQNLIASVKVLAALWTCGLHPWQSPDDKTWNIWTSLNSKCGADWNASLGSNNSIYILSI